MNKQWSLIVVEDGEKVAKKAAEHMRDQLKAKPESVLALPTGRTPLGMYGELVRMCERGEVDFSPTTVFDLDEFYSLPPEHPASFASYLNTHFLERVPLGRVVLLNGIAPDPEAECARVEEEIRRIGGVDLAILGIGRNGHIAFNEPGSRVDSRTRLVALTDSTRRASRGCFPVGEEAPYTALTMGVSTILAARAILLLAIGPQKASILARALCGSVTGDIPASWLQQHPRLTIIADCQAAARFHEA